MWISVLRAKLHHVVVTETRLDYVGSLSVDAAFLEEAGLYPYERVDIYNVTNGARFSTYIIPAPTGSRIIGVNGAAARLAQVGDRLIVVAFAWVRPDEVDLRRGTPRVLIFNSANEIVEVRGDRGWPFHK